MKPIRAGSTRLLVATRRAQNPRATAAQMAREFGVTKERVRQLLKLLGLPTKLAPEVADGKIRM